MLILDLLGIGFHAVVVFGLSKDFLFKSILGRCDIGCFFEDGANLKIPSEIFPSLLRSGEGEESLRAVPTLLLIL